MNKCFLILSYKSSDYKFQLFVKKKMQSLDETFNIYIYIYIYIYSVGTEATVFADTVSCLRETDSQQAWLALPLRNYIVLSLCSFG